MTYERYVVVDGDDRERVCCASCKYPAPLTGYEFNDLGDRKRRNVMFCAICMNTMVGVQFQHSHLAEVHAVTSVIAYCTNLQLDLVSNAFKDVPVIEWPSIPDNLETG